jgi:WD40 repeat protein
VQHWGGVQAIAICPSTHHLYTGSRDFRIKRWALPDPGSSADALDCIPAAKHVATLSAHTGWVTALAATRLALVSTSYDATIRFWNPSSSKHTHTFHGQHRDYVLCLAMASSAARFVTAGLRGHLNFWDLETCVRVTRAKGNDTDSLGKIPSPVIVGGEVSSGSIYALDCSSDGRYAAFNGDGGCARSCGVWSMWCREQLFSVQWQTLHKPVCMRWECSLFVQCVWSALCLSNALGVLFVCPMRWECSLFVQCVCSALCLSNACRCKEVMIF